MTQREFASFLGIGSGRLANWESAEKGTVPSMKTLEMVAARVGCSVNWLVGGPPSGMETVDFPKEFRQLPNSLATETHSPMGVNYGQKEGVSMPMSDAVASHLGDLRARASLLANDARRLADEITHLVDLAEKQAAEPLIPISGTMTGVPLASDKKQAARPKPPQSHGIP